MLDAPDEPAEVVLVEPVEVPLLVVPLDVASPGRLTGACLARAWKAARVLFDDALREYSLVRNSRKRGQREEGHTPR